MQSAASKALAALKEGRLSPSPIDWFRLLRLHYRERAQERASAAAPAIDKEVAGSCRTAPAIDRAILEEMLAAGGRLQFAGSDRPVVSILIPVHNRADLTLRCLRSLAGIRLAIEIVIVDNASTDETHRLLAQVDGVAVIANAVNAGFLIAVNQAATRATGELLLLLNNDTEVLPGSLEAAVETLCTSVAAGAVVGKLVHRDGRLQEAGSIIWNDGSCHGYGRGDNPLSAPYMYRRDVDFGSGAFLLTRRAVFLDSGGFDECYKPAYYEDADYCARLWQSGQRVIYDPRAVIIHAEFGSASSSTDALVQQAERRAVFVARHRQWLADHAPQRDAPGLHARTRSGSGLRVLLIEDRIPHERLGSGYPRSLAIVRALLELGHHVTVFPLIVPDERWDEAYSDVPREAELYVGPRTAGLAPFLAERYSYYDAIIVSRPHNMRVTRQALPPAAQHRPALLYDAEALFALREISRRTILGRALSDQQAERIIGEELALARGCDVVCAVSVTEAQRFIDAGFSNVRVLGNSLMPQPMGPPFADRSGFLFVGAISDDTAPNADSVIWLAREILPRLRARLGEKIRVVVAGRVESTNVARLSDPSIEMTGMVGDLAPRFDRARVFLAPSRFGAGIPTKVQQAAAFGVPVVGTSLVATQLGWTDGVDLLVADDADAFAEQCCSLYTDPGKWHAVRDSAHARITLECSPVVFRSTLQEALLDAQASRSADGRRIGVGPQTEFISR